MSETPVRRMSIQQHLGLLVGGIGAAGQALLMHHELVDCLPYKIMDAFYFHIANIGVLAGPAFALVLAGRCKTRKFWALAAIVAFLCPVGFLTLFAIGHLPAGIDVDLWKIATDRQLHEFSAEGAFHNFALLSADIAIHGTGIGLMCGAMLQFLIRQFRYPRNNIATLE